MPRDFVGFHEMSWMWGQAMQHELVLCRLGIIQNFVRIMSCDFVLGALWEMARCSLFPFEQTSATTNTEQTWNPSADYFQSSEEEGAKKHGCSQLHKRRNIG